MVEQVIDKGDVSEQTWINSEPIGRMGKPEEIAQAVVWLLSDSASLLPITQMVVDGEMVAP
jgi:NAD(P)-dependent dehydrogenase (short-subunit alcohol dehydrogenase family)